MATPGQLVQTMAEALGIPAATVIQYDRVLAENGLRSKSGRGTSAAKITAGDAANLLIAIMGSIAGGSVKEAANSCRTYGSLPVVNRVSGTDNFASAGLEMLDDLPKEHILHEAISALIDSAARGKRHQLKHRVTIRVQGPRPWADIVADTSHNRFARRAYFNFSQRDNADLSQERHVSYQTIRKLGLLLSETEPASPRKARG